MPTADLPLRHFSFLLHLGGTGGAGTPVSPNADGLTLTWEPGGEEAFYFRRKLSGPLVFARADFALLLALENSADRCQPLLLALEARAYDGGPVGLTWRGTFTCNDVEFNLDACTATVSPLPADGYQTLLDNWDRPVNLLAAPAFAANTLRTVRAQLAELPASQSFEFRRIDVDEEGDMVGTDGWTGFLRNTAYISNREREHHSLIFRYRLNAVPMERNATGVYEPRDLSSGGWQFFTRNDTVSPPTADYVKGPEIAGFKAYKIGTFDDWWHTEGGRRPLYGTTLLLLPGGQRPSNYGFSDAGYIQVTGAAGANNRETFPYLNLRRRLSQVNPKSLWWKFGEFSFRRCLPLLDGLYYLLGERVPTLLPPAPEDLSSFFSHPVNPVTGQTGPANELPGLLLSAGSDVKRYGASEPATRLLVSPKQLITDLCALYDLGYDIHPVTGWFRLEHRSFYEGILSGLELDLRPGGPHPRAIVPARYTYLSAKMPRYEQLSISTAVTEDFTAGVSFTLGEIEYDGACVNQREGENTTTRTVTRLTGDLAGLVLSGDALPDSCVALIAATPGGQVLNANRAVAASELLRRYHTYGRVRPTGTVRAATTEQGTAVTFESVRRSRQQEGVTVPLCAGELLELATQVLTTLSGDARLSKASLSLTTGIATLTLVHPAPESTQAGPLLRARQFTDGFPDSFA